MLEPSKVISDQYASSIVQLSSGKSLTGLVVEESDQIIVYTSDPYAEPIVGPRDQVVEIKRSDVSQMPTGLLDSLNRDEVRDLLAYLLSGGNPEDRVYGKKKKK